MKLKLVADGHVWGTRLVDPETGRAVAGVRRVTYEHQAGDIPRLELELICSEVQLVGQVVRFLLPGVGYVRAVELEDGRRMTLPLLAEPVAVDLVTADG